MAESKIIDRRSSEWEEFHIRWVWQMDSFEGGQRYRDAVYGVDPRGIPVRNMVRHKREYPDPREQSQANYSAYLAGTASTVSGFSGGSGGQDQAAHAGDDDYELRRARTPVPTFLAEAVATHLGEIYAKEIRREIPESPAFAGLIDWRRTWTGRGPTSPPGCRRTSPARARARATGPVLRSPGRPRGGAGAHPGRSRSP